MSDERTPAATDAPIPADRAVIDRIVDGRTAVLLVGSQEDLLHVPVEALPGGATEGDWLVLDLAALIVEVDEERTRRRQEAVEARLDRIRHDQGGGRFGR